MPSLLRHRLACALLCGIAASGGLAWAAAPAVVFKMPPLPPVKFEKPDFGRARETVEASAAGAAPEAVTVPVEEGLFLTRRTAGVLVAFAAAMVGLAFATGYLVGQ